MAVEIERKFLVRGEPWKTLSGTRMVQAYLSFGESCTVRIRIAGDQGWLTLKGPKDGISRAEFEYPVPVSDAGEMLASLAETPVVEKTRYTLQHRGHLWEIDVFSGRNAGLVVAEIELDSEEESFDHPDWLDREVTDESRFQNSFLAVHPFDTWKATRKT